MMIDLYMVLFGIVFFGVSALYMHACNRLR